MHLTNDSPSFTPVHSQIRAIGPQDLNLWKGRGQVPHGDYKIAISRLYTFSKESNNKRSDG